MPTMLSPTPGQIYQIRGGVTYTAHPTTGLIPNVPLNDIQDLISSGCALVPTGVTSPTGNDWTHS